ncbi:MAG: GMC oxidoreductase [Bacteroidota bacterium]
MAQNKVYDYIIIGSGFGGSVSALRLAEKGYSVLVLEKGKWFKSDDFPKNNYHLKKWLWEPKLGLQGFFKMTFLRHVTVLSGVGVGGGSLTYANTLPVPKTEFFNSGNWKGLADWENELKPFYETANQMLGAAKNPAIYDAEKALKAVASKIGKEDSFEPTNVAVYFGEPGKTVEDPYFDGKGPSRTGCIHCGQCMTGCRHNAKNTLDKNYLFLAQQLGVEIQAEKEVFDVIPKGNSQGSDGYVVHVKDSFGKKKSEFHCKGIVFAGGVMGTVPLLLKLKDGSLPALSDTVGRSIRTNNEALISVTSLDKDKDFTKGIAIGSILNTDKDSHLEPCRYGKGSGFFQWLGLPLSHGSNGLVRMLKTIPLIIKNFSHYIRVPFLKDYSTNTAVLLFMQHLDSTISFTKSRFGGLKSKLESGERPTSQIPRAKELSEMFEEEVNGKSYTLALETILGSPTTAHILGGAVMGKDETEGVIDSENRVFNYKNMLICDGSMISANPGVNPSLSITAISERAMNLIKPKNEVNLNEKADGNTIVKL